MQSNKTFRICQVLLLIFVWVACTGAWQLHERTRFADTYRDDVDTLLFQSEIHSGPTNYYDGDDWTPTITVPDSSLNPDYAYKLTTAEYWGFFPGPLLVSPVYFGVSDTVGQGGSTHEFTFEALDVSFWDENHDDDYLASPENVAAETLSNPDRIYYYGAYNETDEFEADLEYRLLHHGLKEFVILESLREPAGYLGDTIVLAFSAEISHPTTDMYVDSVKIEPSTTPFITDKPILFCNADTIPKFYLPRPYAVDADGDIVFGEYEIQKQGNSVLLRLRIPWPWLETATYPVRIDASPETVIAGYDITVTRNGGDNFSHSVTDDELYIGIYDVTTERCGIDFNISAISDAVTVTQVQAKLYVHATYGSPDATDMDDMEDGSCTADPVKGPTENYKGTSDATGMLADVDGATYLSGNTDFNSTGSHTVTLEVQAAIDLDNQLGSDCFSLGITMTTENSGDEILFRSVDSSGDDPEIIVTYTAPSHVKTHKPWIGGGSIDASNRRLLR